MSKILIAFSGGPDSVFLYHHLKKENKHKLALCYVNHNLRVDVDNDIKFVRKFSLDNNVEIFIKSIKIDKFSEKEARDKRYEILEKIRKENNFEYIATGHNKNDNVETILFRLIRGTGLDGLKGIPEKRDNIIRPILNFKKEDILEYLNNNKIEFLKDYTNDENKYSRNKIRNQIFPIMKEINPKFIDNISRLIYQINEENLEYDNIKNVLLKYNIKYNSSKLKEIYHIKNKIGKRIKLDDKYEWICTYNYYGIRKIELQDSNFNYELNLNQKISIYGYEINFIDYKTLKNYLEKKEYKIYNIGKLEKIKVRSRQNGDRINSTKIKKILIDLKIDKLIRDKLPILESNKGILSIADLKFSKFLTKEYKEGFSYIAIKKEGSADDKTHQL